MAAEVQNSTYIRIESRLGKIMGEDEEWVVVNLGAEYYFFCKEEVHELLEEGDVVYIIPFTRLPEKMTIQEVVAALEEKLCLASIGLTIWQPAGAQVLIIRRKR